MIKRSKTAQDALAEGSLHAELERLVAELASLAPKPDPPVPAVDPGVASKGPHAVLLGCLTEEHASSKVNTDRVRVKARTEEELDDFCKV